ncbi:methionyl-tRNA formyltransferase [Paracoccus sp. (in: a-proteobacteria)]|uniref:methionyl-tRNA formyltransferase n=1 Tax=Paracoccus sp. TaxID=267 RepID=UPI0035B3E2A5
MRVIFMGTPDFSVPALRAIAARHEVVAVYSQPPRAAGRGQKPRPSPVQRLAEELGLPVRVPERLKSPEDQAEFAALGADVAVVVAYGLILPQPVLDAPRLGCLNIHASLLPRWRGAAPIHRAVMAGDAETGVAIMQMEAGLDTGPVLAEARTPIGADETTADLHDRLADMGAGLIVQTLERLPLAAVPQAAGGVSYATKIDKAEARIDWSRPALEIDRQIRGLSPFPGAWCLIGAERVKLLRSRLVAGSGSGAPGQVLDGFTIACGAGAIEVLEAQREGKRPMPAAEILRGLSLPPRLD